MKLNNKQRWAIYNQYKKEVKEHCPEINNDSGIYCFFRKTEEGNTAVYVGQAKDLWQRAISHMMGRKQHIDKSLYKRKWYSNQNPYGWKLAVIGKYSLDLLDRAEQNHIKDLQRRGYELYNVTGGGQFDKSEDINERHEVKLKSYKNGKSIAEKKIKAQVRNYFDKYLDFVIKGKTNKTKERKFEEFKRWVYEETSKDDC